MKRLCRTLALLITVTLAGLPPAARSAPTHTKLQIDGVQVDATSHTITILGEQFTVGGAVTVTLGEVGDITAQCQTPAPTATVITCTLSGGLPPPGDYLLTVSSGHAAGQIDHYDLTIGAVGPAGPPGATGPQGPPGVIGAITRVNCSFQDICLCPLAAPALLTGGASCANIAGSFVLLASLPVQRSTAAGWQATCLDAGRGVRSPPDLIAVWCYKP